MSVDMTALEGNRTMLEFFEHAIEDGTLAHAYILEGPCGSGKHTTALLCAEALSEGNPASEKIRRGISPDIYEISTPHDRKTIGVDALRRIGEAAYIKPTDLDIKVFIINDAHLMTQQAQNALLKLLEEPPRDTYFFLLTTSATALLPTVISRAPILRMQLFSDDELKSILDVKLPSSRRIAETDPRTYAMLLRTAGGSLGEAIRLFSQDKESNDSSYKKIPELILKLRSGRTAFILDAMTMPEKRDELSSFVARIRLAFRDLIALKYQASPSLLFFAELDEAREISSKFAVSTLTELEGEVESMQRTLEVNVNLYLARLEFALRLWDAYSK